MKGLGKRLTPIEVSSESLSTEVAELEWSHSSRTNIPHYCAVEVAAADASMRTVLVDWWR